jgi:hypothetical protein
MYDKMSFGLMNVGANFKREMDIPFVGERYKFFVIYLDDLTVFSNSDAKHLCTSVKLLTNAENLVCP